MRREPTGAEALVWGRLRRGQLGVRFRRQEPIGRYIVDFAALAVGIVVEIDGETHVDLVSDAIRDRYLESRGLTVLRFFNSDVYENLDGVLAVIAEAVKRRLRLPGEGGARGHTTNFRPARSGVTSSVNRAARWSKVCRLRTNSIPRRAMR